MINKTHIEPGVDYTIVIRFLWAMNRMRFVDSRDCGDIIESLFVRKG